MRRIERWGVRLRQRIGGMLNLRTALSKKRRTVGAGEHVAARPHALQSLETITGSTDCVYDANGNLETASAGKYRAVAYTSYAYAMFMLFLRGALPDATYWPGRRLLAVADALAGRRLR